MSFLQVKVQQPHRFIFEGVPGVGKRTMISAFLREAFGHEQVQVRMCTINSIPCIYKQSRNQDLIFWSY